MVSARRAGLCNSRPRRPFRWSVRAASRGLGFPVRSASGTVIVMRALVLKEFGLLAVEERDAPVPGAGEVLIAVAATGICGSDVHGFTGENGRRVARQIMGHESVGRIAAFGPASAGADLRLDDVVTFNPVVIPDTDTEEYAGREQHSPHKFVIGVRTDVPAAFADYIAVPVRNVVALPAELPISYGALIEPLAVAVHAVHRVQVRPGQKALVVGGGPIGQSVVLALRMAGVTDVIVSEVDENRRALCGRIGATVLNPTDGPLADQVSGAFGQLADVTVDAVGITASIADALNATAFGGSVCLVGMGAPTLGVEAFRISTEERSLIGSFTYSAQDFRDAAAWVAGGPSELGELISREITPEEANDAFAGLARGDGTPGKILVRFDR